MLIARLGITTARARALALHAPQLALAPYDGDAWIARGLVTLYESPGLRVVLETRGSARGTVLAFGRLLVARAPSRRAGPPIERRFVCSLGHLEGRTFRDFVALDETRFAADVALAHA